MNYVELLSERTILSETGRSPKWLLPRLLKIKKYPVNNRYSSTGLCLATRNGGIRQQLHGIGDKDSVVIVDHGSRIKESNLMLGVGRTINKRCIWFVRSTRGKSCDCKPIFIVPWTALAPGYSFLNS
ncbi:sirohydrochlorin ferrochelatase, chloroplastic-like [Camellia sinensis]|uniref:sirohydrochlorin ferrochelatase, chloroplastic-like n=1 Tax=Camellia sinensis TaxID=4442 RepID=UPI001036CA28|nr:sirohydrochlorin ferrochelatase, chloroplastic-like [Camellia sinensis]